MAADSLWKFRRRDCWRDPSATMVCRCGETKWSNVAPVGTRFRCDNCGLTEGDLLVSPRPEVFSTAAEGLGCEGMVTVWDDRGNYLGCMGIEAWERLLREAARAE